MHFGKRLEEDMVPQWAPFYLQYKLLKRHIKELARTASGATGGSMDLQDSSANGLVVQQQITYGEFSFPGPKAHRYTLVASFKSVLEAEVEKVNRFTSAKVTELQDRLLQLLRVNELKRQEDLEKANGTARMVVMNDKQRAKSLAHVDQQQSAADEIGTELVYLDMFVRQNCIAIQKIVKKFDKMCGFDVGPWFNTELLENAPFLKVNLDSLLIALSDVYALLRERRFSAEVEIGDLNQDLAKGISAQKFERKTTKYWVRADKLMAVKSFIIRNLPVYLFDRKQDGSKAFRQRPRDFLREFDHLYGAMRDSHAITSIYLDNEDADIYRTRLDRLEGAQLFRIRWYGDAKSLDNKDYIFTERKTHHESWVMARSVKERFPIKPVDMDDFLKGTFHPSETMSSWMKPDNQGLCLIKNADELSKASELSIEIQAEVTQKKLKPFVRTVYDRTAFQASDNNEVRISIDTSLMMVNEFETSAKQAERRYHWCRDINSNVIPPSDILQFPYCILEVKLNCDGSPDWITALLGDDVFGVQECHKFSKFLTGMAYLHYDRIKTLPYWFDNQPALDPRLRFMTLEERLKVIEKAEAKGEQPLAIAGQVSSQGTSASHSRVPSVNERRVQFSAPDEVGNGANEKTHLLVDFPDESSSAGKEAPAFLSNLRKRFSKTKDGDKQSVGMKPILQKAKVKIEPKTSFANERTFIQWISASSLMITLATLIVTNGSIIGFQAGLVFFPLSFIILIYACFRYQYRAWSFRHNRQQNHDDLIGPMILAGSIAAAMGVILYLMFRFNAPLPYQVPDELTGQCGKLAQTGLPSYFPFSDVAIVDHLIYATGGFTCAVAELNGTTWQKIPFAGKQSVGQFVQAVAVHPTNMDLLYVGTVKPNRTLYVYNRKLNTVVQEYSMDSFTKYDITLKAMTLVPKVSLNCRENDVQLVLNDVHGSLYFVDMPPSNSQVKACLAKTKSVDSSTTDQIIQLQLADVIPSPRTTSGLLDSVVFKDISAVTYDAASNHIFMLFGQSRILRALNLSDATVSKDWKLPGTSNKWSGLAFKHDTNKVTLYLAQTVPGGVWQFQWGSSALLGSFPSCANVYEGDLGVEMEGAALSNDRFSLRTNQLRYVSDF